MEAQPHHSVRSTPRSHAVGTQRTPGAQAQREVARPNGKSRKNFMYKTSMCNDFPAGQCKRGGKCQYAHTEAELQPLPDLRRTKLCRNIVLTGRCSTGAGCAFAHSRTQVRPRPQAMTEQTSADTVANPATGDPRNIVSKELTLEGERAEPCTRQQLVVQNTFIHVKPMQVLKRRSHSASGLYQSWAAVEGTQRTEPEVIRVSSAQDLEEEHAPAREAAEIGPRPQERTARAPEDAGSGRRSPGTKSSEPRLGANFADGAVNLMAAMAGDPLGPGVHIVVKNTFIDVEPVETPQRRSSSADGRLQNTADKNEHDAVNDESDWVRHRSAPAMQGYRQEDLGRSSSQSLAAKPSGQ